MPAGLLQITDCHIGAKPDAVGPLDTLRTVIDAVATLPEPPEAVLVTGDLTDDGGDDHYAALVPVLSEFGLDVFVLPGNHDDRAVLRRHFDVPGSGSEPIQYVFAAAGLRVIVLDTVSPGEASGEFGPERRAWLADELQSGAAAPTLIAMHHPPFVTGLPEMDRIGLPAADREAIAELLNAHPEVQGIAAGHVHRGITALLGGCPVTTIASTFRQLPLDLTRAGVAMVSEPIAFALHVLVDGRLVSHSQTLDRTAG